jgi:hypothetical protein
MPALVGTTVQREANMSLCVHVCVCVCVHIYMYVCMYVYAYTYVFMFVQPYACLVQYSRAEGNKHVVMRACM